MVCKENLGEVGRSIRPYPLMYCRLFKPIIFIFNSLEHKNFSCDERIDMLKRDFHRAPGVDKFTHKAAEALWLMIKDDSAGVNDFDKLAKRPGFTCAACDKKVPPGQRMHSYGVADKCCEACYQNALQEKQPGFTCAMCHDEFPRGNLNYPHDGAGGGRVCKSCYRYMKKYRNVAPK